MRIRRAVSDDLPALRVLIEMSVRGLQATDYTPPQIEGALASVYGVDSRLIADGTYFAVERAPGETVGPPREGVQGEAREAEQGTGRADGESAIIGCGGWSRWRTLFGGDHFGGREDVVLDPHHDAAKIRAFFVHPAWARRGIGRMILDACERAAREAGYSALEMGATLTGVPFYQAMGYTTVEALEVPLANGASLPIVRMRKRC